MNTEINLPKNYAPSEFEDRYLRRMVRRRAISPPSATPRRNRSPIVIPPPNVTGQLHMGHALDETLQDILIRCKAYAGLSPRSGFPAPTTRASRPRSRSRKTSARTKVSPATISGARNSSSASGHGRNSTATASFASSRSSAPPATGPARAFTMDEGCSKAVREVFVNLYNKGLIYRGNRISQLVPALQAPSFPTRRSSTPR